MILRQIDPSPPLLHLAPHVPVLAEGGCQTNCSLKIVLQGPGESCDQVRIVGFQALEPQFLVLTFQPGIRVFGLSGKVAGVLALQRKELLTDAQKLERKGPDRIERQAQYPLAAVSSSRAGGHP